MNEFRFKQFSIKQNLCAMKVGTDGVLLGAWSKIPSGNVLDVGSGSGLISLMIAQRNLNCEIDAIDIELLQILAKRMGVIDKIGHYKNDNDITILQMKRWAGIIEDRLSIGSQLELNKEFLNRILNIIHKESMQRQSDIFKNKKKD